jgi:hypothetical protein
MAEEEEDFECRHEKGAKKSGSVDSFPCFQLAPDYRRLVICMESRTCLSEHYRAIENYHRAQLYIFLGQ